MVPVTSFIIWSSYHYFHCGPRYHISVPVTICILINNIFMISAIILCDLIHHHYSWSQSPPQLCDPSNPFNLWSQSPLSSFDPAIILLFGPSHHLLFWSKSPSPILIPDIKFCVPSQHIGPSHHSSCGPSHHIWSQSPFFFCDPSNHTYLSSQSPQMFQSTPSMWS